MYVSVAHCGHSSECPVQSVDVFFLDLDGFQLVFVESVVGADVQVEHSDEVEGAGSSVRQEQYYYCQSGNFEEEVEEVSLNKGLHSVYQSFEFEQPEES